MSSVTAILSRNNFISHPLIHPRDECFNTRGHSVPYTAESTGQHAVIEHAMSSEVSGRLPRGPRFANAFPFSLSPVFFNLFNESAWSHEVCSARAIGQNVQT
jgi:hypothetical protein